MLAILFQAMITHGYARSWYYAAFIHNRIVKDKRKLTTCSNNYRGISISSVLGKVLDNKIISSTLGPVLSNSLVLRRDCLQLIVLLLWMNA